MFDPRAVTFGKFWSTVCCACLGVVFIGILGSKSQIVLLFVGMF